MSSQTWPELKADHPIIKLHQKLPEILTASEGYNSIWGLTLIAPPAAEPSAISATPPATTSTPPPADAAAPTPEAGPTFGTALILQKFLRANANDVAKAFSQLKDTMVWRKGFFSADGESSKGWSETKFKGIGYVNTIKHKSGVEKVVSWNIYGATKDIKATFGGLDEFIRWRVNLMEESLTRLKLGEATEPIPDYGQGEDPYMSLQVHDYMNVSFLRLPSEVKAASKKTIEMFARYYPETLERKFFVNVPALMGWVYSFIKRLLSNATVSKLEMLSSSKELASWLGEDIPKQYGG
ncbi:phosphatidylinositol transfer protein SFH5, partial [Tricharina praecox]|uniref:phosphatidylinositol transfer protein SFH5 n=1 Tax=Tricharina praecox TaxID=43433 RepID=UPI002220ADF3